MADSETKTDEMIELFQKMTVTTDAEKFKWSGTLMELKSFIGNLLCTDCENKKYVKGGFKCTPLSLRVTLYSNKTVLFQGKDAENITQLILSHRTDEAYHHCFGCCPIYENEYKHIIRRDDEEPILGYPYQFCAAFYHTHRWGVGNGVREHQCLDERRCIISKRALHEVFKVQPKTVAAVVKFENRKKKVVYQAKYTNCVSQKKHAEDFFKEDVEKGELKNEIDKYPNGTITMYLTLQPCNKSTSIKGTEGTPPNKSCCDTLKTVSKKILTKKKTRLRIKVTHVNRLSTLKANKPNDEKLRKNAVEGIKKLMDAGIEISAMNQKDWDYLFSMTMKKPRDELDQEIQDILKDIADTDKKTLLR